jgi:hypothetical protein
VEAGNFCLIPEVGGIVVVGCRAGGSEQEQEQQEERKTAYGAGNPVYRW